MLRALKNTPFTEMSYSPSPLLMSQSTRSILPVHSSILKPAIPNNVNNELLLQKQKQKSYYNQTAKPLLPMEKGRIIRV